MSKNPSDWKIRSIDELLTLEYGKGLTESERDENGDYPVYGSNGIVGIHSKFFVEGPGIIVGRKGTVGAVEWVCENFWPIDTTYYVKIKDQDIIDFKWAFYKLDFLDLKKLNMATGVPGLNRDLVYDVKIPIPPRKEQQKIAFILENIDNAIDSTQNIIEKYEMMKKGLMQDLFIDTDANKGWVTSVLGNKKYFSLATGGTPSTEIPEYWGGEIKWMVSGDVHKKVIFEVDGRISKDGYNNSNARVIPKQSILIALAGQGKTRGTVAINRIELTTNQSVAAIIPNKEKIDPNFLFYSLDNQYDKLRVSSAGAGRAGLSLKILGDYEISFPADLIKQEEISVVFSSIYKKISSEHDYLKKLQKIKIGLMQDLLTGKVQVKVES